MAAFNEIASAWHLKPLGSYCIGISSEIVERKLVVQHTHTAVAKLIFGIQVHVFML